MQFYIILIARGKSQVAQKIKVPPNIYTAVFTTNGSRKLQTPWSICWMTDKNLKYHGFQHICLTFDPFSQNYLSFLSLLCNSPKTISHFSPKNQKHREKAIIRDQFFQTMAKYCSFLCRLRKFRWKMLYLSVPKHFDHGVSKFRQPFVSNTMVDMFEDTFLVETPNRLAKSADISPKIRCLPCFG